MIQGIAQWLQQHRRWPIGIVGVLVLYAAIGFLWVPRLARNAIEAYVHTELHRQITIGDLAFNPFTFTARIKSFALTEADGAAIASFDGLIVNAELSSVVHRGPTFKEIRFDNPRVLLRVNADGSLNLAKLAPPTDTASDTANAAQSELPRVRIGVFALHGGRVTVEDLTHPKPFTATLAPIEFTLTNFRTEPKFGNAYRFVASTADQESLDWSGEFSVQPLGSTGRFTLANIKAATIAAYLQDALPFDLQSGILDMQGAYALAFTNRVDFNLQLPTIKAREVGIALRAGEPMTPWISLPQLSITGASLSFVDRKLSVNDIRVSDMVIDAWREADGGINLARLFASDATDAPTAKPTAPSNTNPWIIGVKNLQIERARVNAEDRSILPNAKLALQPIDIKVADYSSEPKSALTIEASMGVGEHGLVTVGGPVTLSPLALQLDLGVKDFDLASLQPYAAQATDMTIHRGRLLLKTRLNYAAEPPRGQPQFKLTGDIEVADLLTKDNALKEDFIKWQSLRVSGIDFQQAPDRLSIARIYARKPYGRVIIAADGTFNITKVLSPSASAAASGSESQSVAKESAEKPKQSSPARIRSIVIEDGSASFADYSVAPSFATEIAELKGSVEGLSSERDSRAKVQLAGSVDRYAPVSITGEVNLLSTETFTDVAMSFRNMELTTFNPYSGKFAGYNISKGKLTTEMQYKVENRKLDARHHIVIDQLEFGPATDSKDAVSLPIKFAVALLKDRHGVINLDLPISGSIDDPTFRVGPIIWQVLKNTLEKIVTLPFALIGKLFGGGEELAYLDFAHGSTLLTPDVEDKLGKLKQAMIERPQLKLDVPLLTFDEADRTTLTRTAFEQALDASLKVKPDRLAALAAIYTKEFGVPPTYLEVTDKSVDVAAVRTTFLEDALLAKFSATPAQLEALGRGRGAAVRDALLTGSEIAAERIFLSARTSEGKSPPDLVRMELKLE